MKKVFVTTLCILTLLGVSGCNKKLIYSKDREMEPLSKTFATSPDDAFETAREALTRLGYKIDHEDKSEKVLTTGWQSTKATSHYVDLFDRKDYGTVGAYYRLRVKVEERGGKAAVEVSAPVRSIVGRIKTNYREEKKLFRKMADLLRREDFEMSNVGVED